MMKINEKSYAEGVKAFKKGKSLRSIVEPMIAVIEDGGGPREGESLAQRMERREAEQSHWNSVLLGFADGFLSKVRGI